MFAMASLHKSILQSRGLWHQMADYQHFIGKTIFNFTVPCRYMKNISLRC
jgi:hypothetical protein